MATTIESCGQLENLPKQVRPSGCKW